MSKGKQQMVECPMCRHRFPTEWGAGDFETCRRCKTPFLISERNLRAAKEAG